MTTLPKGDEYQQAVQTPTISFADSELKRCEVETTVLGLPKPYSGGFTTTYQLRGAKNWAVRYLPELANLIANELGHPNFQHPNRTVSDYDKTMDRFSTIVIYLALKALMIDPKLWEMFENGENLLFKSNDFARPEASPLLKQLETYSELKDDVQNFKTICQLPYAEIPDLQAFRQGSFTDSAQTQRTFDGTNHAALLKHLGEKINIITKINNVYIADAALFIFLNGESVGDKRFKLVIWSEEIIALHAQGMNIHSNGIRFENIDYQWISVTGILSVHKGNPQVTLENPNQLQLLKDAFAAQNRLKSFKKKPSAPTRIPQKVEKRFQFIFFQKIVYNRMNNKPL
jgi:hypothetical protein